MIYTEDDFFADEDGQTRFEIGDVSDLFLNGSRDSWEHRSVSNFWLNMVICMRIQGKLSIPRIIKSIEKIYEDEESLRMIFEKNDEAPMGYYGMFLKKYPYPVEVEIPEGDTPDERFESVKKMLLEMMDKAPDVENDVTSRFMIHELGKNDHVITVFVNHMASDGTSLANIMGKMASGFFGIDSIFGRTNTAPLHQYLKELETFRKPENLTDIDYWNKEREGYQPVSFRPHDPTDLCFKDEDIFIHLSKDKLRKFCRKEKATITAAVTWAFHYAIASVYNTWDTAISFTSENRTKEEYFKTTGPFIQLPVHRFAFDPEETLADSCRRGMKKMFENIEHSQNIYRNIEISHFVMTHMDYRSMPVSYKGTPDILEMSGIPGYNLSLWIPTYKLNMISENFLLLLVIESKKELAITMISNTEVFHHRDLMELRNKLAEGVQILAERPDALTKEVLKGVMG